MASATQTSLAVPLCTCTEATVCDEYASQQVVTPDLFDRSGTIIQSGAFVQYDDTVCRVSEIHARISVVDVTDLASRDVIRVFHPRTELTILGYTIQPASCNGYHVKHNGRVERREDRKPHVFTTIEQCEDYIRQSYSSMHTQEVEVVQ